MDCIYDNGYKMLGQNKNLKKHFNSMLKNGLEELEETLCKDILEELNEYSDDTIIVLDYDYGMGNYICAWTKENIVKESE